MAKLYFRYGAMNSGKSTALMQVAHNYEEQGMRVLILKPQVDTKGGGELVSRLGVRRRADLLIPPEVDVFEAVRAASAGEQPLACVLCDESLFSLFETGHLETAPGSVIARCVQYKAGVVERDEKEQNERRLLNLGHTVGHAIEKCSGYAIPHGHAVAAGLAIIARSAETLGWTEGPIAARIAACLAKNNLPTGTEYTAEALAAAALADKKRTGGDITLVIPRHIGACELKRVPVTELLPIIAAGLEG